MREGRPPRRCRPRRRRPPSPAAPRDRSVRGTRSPPARAPWVRRPRIRSGTTRTPRGAGGPPTRWASARPEAPVRRRSSPSPVPHGGLAVVVVDRERAQGLAQVDVAAMRAYAHRARGGPEHGGDIVERQLLEPVQLDDLALLGRKIRERPP